MRGQGQAQQSLGVTQRHSMSFSITGWLSQIAPATDKRRRGSSPPVRAAYASYPGRVLPSRASSYRILREKARVSAPAASTAAVQDRRSTQLATNKINAPA